MATNEPGAFLEDPKACPHDWVPVSMVFETRLVDDAPGGGGRYRIAPQPDLEKGRVYLVCLGCSQYTYMQTNWAGFRLEGSLDRGFDYRHSSSHPYSLDGRTWQENRPISP